MLRLTDWQPYPVYFRFRPVLLIKCTVSSGTIQHPAPLPPIRHGTMSTITYNAKGKAIELGTKNIEEVIGGNPHMWSNSDGIITPHAVIP